MSGSGVYRARAEMAPRAAGMLRTIMESHAFRELEAAQIFGHSLRFVTSAASFRLLGRHVMEEANHYAVMAKVYQDFTGNDLEPIMRKRLLQRPVPFVGSWLELAMVQFLFDRAGFWQLQVFEQCSYLPYREALEKILGEERGHQAAGERVVVDLCASGEHEQEKQKIFNHWLRQGLLCFGRPDTENERYALDSGIKCRRSAEVMQGYVDDIKPAMKKCGLKWPAPQEIGIEAPPGLSWA